MSKSNKAVQQNNTAENAENKRRQRRKSAQQNNTQTEQKAQTERTESAEREQNAMTEQNAVQSAQHAENTQQSAEQTAEQNAQTVKRTRAERITERNALYDFIQTLAQNEYHATVGGASDETMKHRAVQRNKHMIIKLVLSDTSIRICVKAHDELKNIPDLKEVNYNLPYQFLFKDNSAETHARIEKIFSVAFTQYETVQKEKAEKKAQKASKKKAEQ